MCHLELEEKPIYLKAPGWLWSNKFGRYCPKLSFILTYPFILSTERLLLCNSMHSMPGFPTSWSFSSEQERVWWVVVLSLLHSTQPLEQCKAWLRSSVNSPWVTEWTKGWVSEGMICIWVSNFSSILFCFYLLSRFFFFWNKAS